LHTVAIKSYFFLKLSMVRKKDNCCIGKH
jgi:hypothetical protein